MNKIISAGFIIQGKDGRYLLGKADGHDGPSCYTIFKGGVENNEQLIDAAIRELKEESGIDVNSDHRLNKNISTNPVYQYSLRHKDVFVFILSDVEGVLNDYKFSCSSFWRDDRPEICDYRWFTLEEMEENIFPSQKGLVGKLKTMHKEK